MTNLTSTDRIRGDCRLITQTLRKLSTPRVLIRAVVVVAAVLLWLWVSSLLLQFGRGMTYASLESFGQQVIDILVRINPYLWWAAVALWTLIVFFSVRSWFNASVEAGRAAPVPADEFRSLTAQLSPEVRDVMRWSWLNHDEPFTVGDLRRTLAEIRRGRIDKIAIVREQESILKLSEPDVDAPAAVAGAPLRRTTPAKLELMGQRAEPGVRIAGETRASDAPRQPVEPRLNPSD